MNVFFNGAVNALNIRSGTTNLDRNYRIPVVREGISDRAFILLNSSALKDSDNTSIPLDNRIISVKGNTVSDRSPPPFGSSIYPAKRINQNEEDIEVIYVDVPNVINILPANPF